MNILTHVPNSSVVKTLYYFNPQRLNQELQLRICTNEMNFAFYSFNFIWKASGEYQLDTNHARIGLKSFQLTKLVTHMSYGPDWLSNLSR